jgi:hypothetical protein
MKRRRLVLILLGCVAAITLAVLIWPRQREPEYKGIPLSTWLEQYKWEDAEFAAAIKHMGTNALPFLIRAAKYEEPSWRTWLGRTTSKWPTGALNSRFGQWLMGHKSKSRASSSVIAFGILGADADPALDELRRIQRDSKDPSTSDRARQCIEFITERIGIGVYRPAM